MTTPCDARKPHPCDCPETAEPGHINDPGLPAIRYRIGTHATFLQRMLDRLHTDPLLREQLTVRKTDDPAIALLDAWAIVGDVLSFYQERIANEGYLHTATERRSVLEMARMVGYELNPGVAAGAYLAFTVDDTTKSDAQVTIPEGTQVQSLPAQGKLPQTFETSREFIARAEWNELKPRRSRHQTLGIKGGKLYLLSLTDDSDEFLSDFYVVHGDNYLQDGDKVAATEVNTLFLEGIANTIQKGDPILLAGTKKTEENPSIWKTLILPVVYVETDKKRNRTLVQVDGTSETIYFPLTGIQLIGSIATGIAFDAVQVQDNVLFMDIRQNMLSALMKVNRWDRKRLLDHIRAVQSASDSLSDFQGVFTFREQVGFFGNNAPVYSALDESIYTADWDVDGWEIWKKYPDKQEYAVNGADVYLERKVDGIGKGSWAIFSRSGTFTAFRIQDSRHESITGFSLSGKSTGLILADENGDTISKSSAFKVRNTTAHVKSECMELGSLPIEDDLEEAGTDESGAVITAGSTQVMLDGIVLDLTTGQPVIINGEQVDARGVTCHEVALLKDVIHRRGYTVLYFQEALQHRYVRDSVTINANVVPATHGESGKEVLGSGDGTKTNQRFVLKKPPLTYVRASTASGSESTLTVKVDDVAWEEASSLYGRDARSRNYMVRLDNDGKVGVQFGDGSRGARLPTGQENIVATYRSGIGFDGEVDAGSLSLLKTRPPGIRRVTNPIAASGADDPESMDSARTNAPLTVLTMDRIVSLSDYEDFARAFTGIGKAKAVVLWNGETDLVHITVAGPRGITIDSSSTTYGDLLKAIDAHRNPMATVQVDTFDLRLFHVLARVRIDDRYTEDVVLAAADTSLQDAFSFQKRDFGQSVSAAEVIHIIQQVPGIVYVDLNKLYLADDETGPDQTMPASILKAYNARWPQRQNLQAALKAELLLINPVGIKLEKMKS